MTYSPFAVHDIIKEIEQVCIDVTSSFQMVRGETDVALGHVQRPGQTEESEDISFDFRLLDPVLSNHQRLVYETGVKKGQRAIKALHRQIIEAAPCLDNHAMPLKINARLLSDGSPQFQLILGFLKLRWTRQNTTDITCAINKLDAHLHALPRWDGQAIWTFGGKVICANSIEDADQIQRILHFLEHGWASSLRDHMSREVVAKSNP